MISVQSPELILNRETCLANIRRMAEKASVNGLTFRPHFKTHQSLTIGRWFRDCGVTAITVSSIKMAGYFAGDGWRDITIAIPVNRLQIRKINSLASRIDLNIDVISTDTLQFLAANLTSPVGAFIEIDNGYNRTGLDPNDSDAIEDMISLMSATELLRFRGFLSHAGNTYGAGSLSRIGAIHSSTVRMLAELKAKYSSPCHDITVSIGDTPSCSLLEDFRGVDEIRPGNFVFYDIMQEQIGSCSFRDIAVALAVPVLAMHPQRNEIVVEGGAIHLSKEFITDGEGRTIYGYPVHFTDNGWTVPDRASYVRSLTQEHGVVKASGEFFNSVNVGDIIGILPVHSCLTAHQMRRYVTPDGELISTMNS